MSVLRQQHFQGQERIDVPHLRSIESGVCADFDVLGGLVMAGGQALVVKGFDIVTSGAIGSPASSLQLNVAGGVLLHPTGSESGTIFSVPTSQSAEALSATNANLVGSFTSNQINYVGLDIRRSADTSTTDLAGFLDSNTLTETIRSTPMARTLSYKIVVSTVPFSASPNVLPIAIVATDSSNIVTSIQDARQMFFRLGAGGTTPDISHSYGWPAGRAENTSGAVFAGGDKAISSFKNWADSVMTRLWELGGGSYWYSGTTDREVKLCCGPSVLSNGDNFAVTGTTVTWQGLSLTFGNSGDSTLWHNTIQDNPSTGIALAAGECLYVDMVRSSTATVVPQHGVLGTLGTPVVPGSRFVLAWSDGTSIYFKDRPYQLGRAFPVASTLIQGTVQLSHAAGTPSTPTVVPIDVNGALSVTATATSAALIGTGYGTGQGVAGTGGSANGIGVLGVGGASNGTGVQGSGTGSGTGVVGVGLGTGHGVHGTGGDPTTYGGLFDNGSATGTGLKALGNTTGSGLIAVGGSSSGVGAYLTGGNGTGAGGIGAIVFGGQGTTTGAGGTGLTANGGSPGSSGTALPGVGAILTGADDTHGLTGGIGLKSFGGTANIGGAGGVAIYGLGGAGGSGGPGGHGATVTGGVGYTTNAGDGIQGTGGAGSGVGGIGGNGGRFVGGSAPSGTGGYGVYATGGTSGSSGGAAFYADSSGPLPALRTNGLSSPPSNGVQSGDLFYDTAKRVWRVYDSAVVASVDAATNNPVVTGEWSMTKHTTRSNGVTGTGDPMLTSAVTAGAVTYYLDLGHVVHLRGSVTITGTSTQAIFTLPDGFKPAASLYFPVVDASASSMTYATVTNVGVVTLYGITTGHTYDLSSISFASLTAVN